ncbi:MAG TPA: cytochrome c3 family protein [Coriobacteriia bacterium]|nr:cytochrome c3 family protein [Coriobacteriia bacterium]
MARASRQFIVVLFAVVVLALATPAYAYYTESMPATDGPVPDCVVCHGTKSPSTGDVTGPHGGYSTTTNKCGVCHTVHNAPAGGLLLLPSATVKDTCEMCHDGTGGAGVYGVLAKRDIETRATHSVESTNVIPGGDPSSGASATAVFGSLSGMLTCTDCHSPHGNDVVAAFTGDRVRGSVDVTITSSRLLKKRPTTATRTVEVYGSDWCASCHKGRLSGSGKNGNHPVESTLSTTSPYTYDNVVRVAGVETTATVLGSLGRNNFGYVMPVNPRSKLQSGHSPICQQCHEDARRVGDVIPQQLETTELFSIVATDGSVEPDNPRFQTFPHESPNEGFLIEQPANGLCLNCHQPT